MELNQYQRTVVRAADANDYAHEIVPMLGIGGHIGALLLAHQRYLCESLVAETSKGMVVRELGMVLRSCALLTHLLGLELEAIVHSNLVKIDRRARTLGYPGIARLPDDGAIMDASTYQALASETDQEISAGVDPLSLSVPMLGLAGEAGNLLVEDKKRFRRDSKISDWQAFVSEELGDLLWYVATLARHLGLDLDHVLDEDLKRLALSTSITSEFPKQKGFDADFPATERLPRQMRFQFQDRLVDGTATATMTLLDAMPNAFPSGPLPRGQDKFQGFQVGAQLGDQVNDNSRRADAYRFHDAIHLGFVAVLGWSPNLRGLLQLKRKSNPSIDEAEDGARAIFAEEGLAAILAKQASSCRQFATPSLVPEGIIDLIAIVVEDLEVSAMPYRMWRDAISQGFTVMEQLAEGGGGYVLADLDARSLQYSKFPFPSGG